MLFSQLVNDVLIKYLKTLIVDYILLGVIIFILLDVPILSLSVTLLCLIYMFKFSLELSMSKNFTHSDCQFLTNFPGTNANAGSITGLN